MWRTLLVSIQTIIYLSLKHLRMKIYINITNTNTMISIYLKKSIFLKEKLYKKMPIMNSMNLPLIKEIVILDLL